MIKDLLIFIVFLLLPFIAVGLFAFVNPKSKLNLLINIVLVTLIFFTLFYHIQWYLTSIYLRYLFFIFFLFTIYKNLRHFSKVLFRIERTWLFKVVFIFKILLILFFAFESYWVYVGLKAPDNTISIDFPLKHGTFAITSGGSSNMVNAHFEKEPYCYAVDIIKLNSYGRMWDKSFLKSEKLFDYPSFNDTVFAPCNGKIIEISDNKEDQPIGIEGKISNYIRIEYKEKYVIMLAHLKKNSMMVKLNESVISGQPIALIGNSGQSNDPHLHMHLVHRRLDIYMPFKFNGRFPIINDIFNN